VLSDLRESDLAYGSKIDDIDDALEAEKVRVGRGQLLQVLLHGKSCEAYEECVQECVCVCVFRSVCVCLCMCV
jgi:hypothetical protein